MVPFSCIFFDRNGRKITPRILCCLSEREDGMMSMMCMGFERRPYKCVETGSVHFWCIFLGTKKTYKIETQFLVGFFQRKERDSNPRSLSAHRFSRPAHSTTLPSFQGQRYNLFSVLQNFSRKVESTTLYFVKKVEFSRYIL